MRRIHYATVQGHDELEDFDVGIERGPHVSHCLEYLRQSIMCSADSTLEPAEDRVERFLGGGLQRECRDFGALKSWAEEWRAFDGHSFIFSSSD